MNNRQQSFPNPSGDIEQSGRGPRPSNDRFSARAKQAARLNERRSTALKQVLVCGKQFSVLAGVYDTGLDTELMVDAVRISKDETFLEVGCGTGAASVLIAQRARAGIGLDINPIAIENSIQNAHCHSAGNVRFIESDLFEAVQDEFDVVVCNPPYSCASAGDVVDMMFWDTNDRMKQQFFKEVRFYLKPYGRLYFGWADFRELDINLPRRLAGQHGLSFRSMKQRASPSGDYHFKVLEFQNTGIDKRGNH